MKKETIKRLVNFVGAVIVGFFSNVYFMYVLGISKEHSVCTATLLCMGTFLFFELQDYIKKLNTSEE